MSALSKSIGGKKHLHLLQRKVLEDFVALFVMQSGHIALVNDLLFHIVSHLGSKCIFFFRAPQVKQTICPPPVARRFMQLRHCRQAPRSMTSSCTFWAGKPTPGKYVAKSVEINSASHTPQGYLTLSNLFRTDAMFFSASSQDASNCSLQMVPCWYSMMSFGPGKGP